MKICLIYPKSRDIEQCMPLAFGYLISNTKGHDFKIIDCNLEDIDIDSFYFKDRIMEIEPNVVGVFSWSATFGVALNIFKKIKEINQDIITILGGPHATVDAKNSIKNKEIDFVFRGEAEKSFQIFLDELKKEKPDFSKVNGLAYKNKNDYILNEISIIEDLDSIEIPDYNSINLEGYLKRGYRYQSSKKRSAPIIATRGCPYNCAFCSASLISGRRVRKHSIEYLIKWIKFLYIEHNIRGFVLLDDNFTFDINYAKNFCREIIKLKFEDIDFNTPNGIRVDRGDRELWNLMKRAGWHTIFFAIESGSEKILKTLNKNLNLKIIPNIISDMQKEKLKVCGFFMVGCPEETTETLKETEEFIKKCKFDLISGTIFQPLPGTLIYSQLLDKKEINEGFLPSFYHQSKWYPNTLKDVDLKKFIHRMYLIKWISNPRLVFKTILTQPLTILKNLFQHDDLIE